MTRNSLILTGLIGLVGAVLLTALALFVVTAGWIPILVDNPIYVWGLFLFLLLFSVAEIPVMIFALRRMVESLNPRAKYVVLITNAGYTFFGAVYAIPFILLAGETMTELVSGATLAALSFVRFATAIIFLSSD